MSYYAPSTVSHFRGTQRTDSSLHTSNTPRGPTTSGTPGIPMGIARGSATARCGSGTPGTPMGIALGSATASCGSTPRSVVGTPPVSCSTGAATVKAQQLVQSSRLSSRFTRGESHRPVRQKSLVQESQVARRAKSFVWTGKAQDQSTTGESELERSLKEAGFELMEQLGKGEFSVCQKGLDHTTGQMVAIKMYIKPERTDIDIRFQRQIDILKELQQPLKSNRLRDKELLETPIKDLFLQLIAHCNPSDPIKWIATEMATESLDDFLQRQPNFLPRHQIQKIGRSVVKALAALHCKSLVHFDIKPPNIMLFGDTWKLIDLEGCIPPGNQLVHCSAFSPIYAAPEFARPYVAGVVPVASTSMDVWSAGMTLAEMIRLEAPLQSMHRSYLEQGVPYREASQNVLRWLSKTSFPPQVDTGDDKQLADLLFGSLLVPDPRKRKDIAEILQHEFFENAVADNAKAKEEAAAKAEAEAERRSELPEEFVAYDSYYEARMAKAMAKAKADRKALESFSESYRGSSESFEASLGYFKTTLSKARDESLGYLKTTLSKAREEAAAKENTEKEAADNGKQEQSISKHLKTASSASTVCTAESDATRYSASEPEGLTPSTAASVTFSVICCTALGEELHVVGNVAALGQWDPHAATAMQWTDGHKWVTTVDLSDESGESIEYKYVLMSDGRVKRWESCDNRVLVQFRSGTWLCDDKHFVH